MFLINKNKKSETMKRMCKKNEAVSKEKTINQGRALKNSPAGFFSEGARLSGGVSKH